MSSRWFVPACSCGWKGEAQYVEKDTLQGKRKAEDNAASIALGHVRTRKMYVGDFVKMDGTHSTTYET